MHYKGYVANGAEVVALADIHPLAFEARQRAWKVPQVFAD